jgi:hypothetical protein
MKRSDTTKGEGMDELDDAIIEDTVHCTVCQASFVLGANEPYVLLDPPGTFEEATNCEQVKLYPECAARAARLYLNVAEGIFGVN